MWNEWVVVADVYWVPALNVLYSDNCFEEFIAMFASNITLLKVFEAHRLLCHST